MQRLASALILSLALVGPAVAQTAPTYADLVDAAMAAAVVARATVIETDRLGSREAPDVPAGHARLLVTAGITAALRAPDVVPARLEYLWDAPLDARGRPPRLKGASVLLFAATVPGRPGQLRLISARGQIDVAAEPKVRAILAELAAGTTPVVTGVSGAFHVPGSVEGEAESQFFLATASGRPVSAVVLSRPGQAKRLQVALGEVIDDAAAGVARDTLLWYRLACGLPAALPAGVGDDARPALEADYAFVLSSLGRCERSVS